MQVQTVTYVTVDGDAHTMMFAPDVDTTELEDFLESKWHANVSTSSEKLSVMTQEDLTNWLSDYQ